METGASNDNDKTNDASMSIKRDIDLSDFRHTVDHCSLSGKAAKNRLLLGLTEMITGARLLRVGTADRWQEPLVANVRLAASDALADHGEVSPVSQLVGTPIRLRRYAQAPGGKDNKMNPLASFLMLRTDVDDREWGQIPPLWDGPVGTVLAVREDSKVAAKLVRRLAQYCMDWVYPRFHRASQELASQGHTREAKQAVVDTVTSEDFEKFIKQWEGK